MSKAYIKFAGMFCNLSPFELKHLSEHILCRIEHGFEEKLCGSKSKAELTERDIKYAITEAMQDILLDLKQRELQAERVKLSQTRAQIFCDRKVVA
jgi:hypothetical protein